MERIGPGGAPVGGGEVRSLRVAAGGTDLARLVGVRRDGPVPEDDVHALERAATVAALLITREESITAVENKYQGDFLREVFAKRARDAAYVEEHAAAFGWTLGRPVVVVAAEIDPSDPAAATLPAHQRRRYQERFSAAWRQVTQGLDPGIPSVDFSSEVVVAAARRRGSGRAPRRRRRTPDGGRRGRRQGWRPPVLLGRRQPGRHLPRRPP